MREDWTEAALGEVFETVTGNTPSKKETDNYGSEIPFIKPPQINNNFLKTSAEFLSAKGKIKARILPINSVLVTCIGNLGRIGINKAEVAFNQQINAIKPISGVEPKYTFYQAQSVSFRNQLERLSTSTTVALVNKTSFNSVKFKIAPLPIQKAIVKKIEALFSSLDSGIADLKKAQDQLGIYRQAVLKKAFEGELTKEWRAKQTDLPSAAELLKQIKEERQKHYDQQLAVWKEAVKIWEGNGKQGKKPSKPKIIKSVEEFTETEIDNKDVLPNFWTWSRLGNIFQVFVGSTPSRNKQEYWDNGSINWVSSGEVAFKSIFQTKEKITIDGLNNASTSVHPIGTVMLAMIGEGKTRGQAAILEIEACHNQNTAAIRVSEIGFEPKYLFHYLFLKYERNRRVGSGNNQKALNQGRIMDFDFPLCSKQEQQLIVKEIESRLSVCDKVEKDIADSLEKAQALRQSILKKAFEGKLLNEEEMARCKADKEYEPASVLLEKIRAEKLAIESTTKKSKPRKKKTIKKKPPVPGKISTDMQAGVIAKVIHFHENDPKHLAHLTHVKCEKISHLVEYHLQIPLGRVPVKDAAGPDDYNHLKKVEHRAGMSGYFKVVKKEIGHTYAASRNITKAIDNLESKVTAEQKKQLDNLINLFLKFDLERAEIIATLYAGWNNLLIDGKTPTDDEIVYESRENWSKRKLTIKRERFYKALQWMRKDEIGLVPIGFGTKVLKPKK